MQNTTHHSTLTIAFLTVIEIPEIGDCGGMLILNHLGRPIEFHCAAPVQASRTQQILFGLALKPFLFCEQIAPALLEQVKKAPDLILVDQPAFLEFQPHSGVPVCLVARAEEPAVPILTMGKPRMERLRLEEFCIAWPASRDLPESHVEALRAFASQLPVDEPFERIRQAIDEAHAVPR